MKKYLAIVNKENKIKPSYIKKIELVKRKNYLKEEVLIEKQTALAFDELKECRYVAVTFGRLPQDSVRKLSLFDHSHFAFLIF